MIFTDSGESIGPSCTKEFAENFIKAVGTNFSELADYMPDSDTSTIKYLEVGLAV